MLTEKQRELLAFLIAHQNENDSVTPSFDEMKQAIGLASKSGVHRLVSALEERRYIRRLANRARAIEVIKTPSGMPHNSSNVISPAFGDAQAGVVELPLLGRIAAGTPIEALSDPSTFTAVPQNLLAGGEHFALEIIGDSMINAGIHEGDTVIICRTETANSGDIIVALIDDSEATLKTLRREPGRIGLEPANPNYETRYFESNQVRIQGRLTGLIRRY